MACGIVLHHNGWRVHYLGADTPIGELGLAIRDIRPELAVLAAVNPSRYTPYTADLARLASIVCLGLAGAGATSAIAFATGARLLAGDPITEAHRAREWAL